MSPKPHTNSSPKIALVCDWLTTPGGAEKVLLELHRMYPDAPIYTSQYSKKGINWFDDATVKTGWLQILPRGLRKFLGPLRQLYFSHLDLSSYDIVISVTGAEAKSVRTAPKSPKAKKTKRSDEVSHPENKQPQAYHICYCHVPTQYYWQMYDKYVENPGFGILNPLVRACFKLLVKPLRKADYRAAQQPDQFVTISTYAQQQIQQYYNRESVIVSPNVDVAKFRPKTFDSAEIHRKSPTFPQETASKSTAIPPRQAQFSTNKSQKSTAFPQTNTKFSTNSSEKSTGAANISTQNPQVFHKFSTSFPQTTQLNAGLPQDDLFASGNYYIISCRQVTWKRVDLAISACRELEAPLLVVGDGSEHQNLIKLAAGSRHIKFLPWTASDQLAEYLQNAKAYLFPSLEPFGIAAVEALAAGCPVIAYAEGGSRDIVIPKVNGLLFDAQISSSLAQAIKEFQTLTFDRCAVSRSADRFDTQHFRHGIEQLVAKASPVSQPASSKSNRKGSK